MVPLSIRPAAAHAAAAALIAVALAAAAASARAGGGRPPERETRAVWITTVAGLDWPSSRDPVEQRASLAAIVDRLHRSGFNTIFFQVRGRGDAVYRSSFEPWSPALTGEQGRDPGWDPLAFILEEAHGRGMEVHAWFNTYFVRGTPGRPPRTAPPHVMTLHPEWAVLHDGKWWLDPGEPGVEEWLLRVAREIVERYAVDGLHLDYVRYPGRDFDDGRTFARHGAGAPLDRWRRANVTRFVERLRALLLSVDPMVKLGAAPIGIYRNEEGVRGMESYSDVFQDTHDWTDRGLVDYVAPQLYWPLGGGGGDPDFALLARRWREETPGVHLYTGIGSYKEEVLPQSDLLIEAARAARADGQAFFRWASIAPILPLASYPAPVLPPPMPWKDSIPPEPPASVRTEPGPSGNVVRWEGAGGEEEPEGYYAVYRIRGAGGEDPAEERLAAVVPAALGAFTDSAAAAGGPGVWYLVTRVDRAWNESPPVASPAGAPGAPGGPAAPDAVPSIAALGAIRRAAGPPERLLLPLRLDRSADVEVTIVRETGGGDAIRVPLGVRPAGPQIVALEIPALASGTYRCIVRAGESSRERRLTVAR